jgi:predicted DNA-binding transcriptional regulator AlpA
MPELVRVEELAALTGMSERKIWRLVAERCFPAPQEKPLRPRLWRTAEVAAWLEAQERAQVDTKQAP